MSYYNLLIADWASKRIHAQSEDGITSVPHFEVSHCSSLGPFPSLLYSHSRPSDLLEAGKVAQGLQALSILIAWLMWDLFGETKKGEREREKERERGREIEREGEQEGLRA